MNFVKGAVLGSVATATAVMLYKEMDKNTMNTMIKKGKHMVKTLKRLM